jgi:hypothetical protein
MFYWGCLYPATACSARVAGDSPDTLTNDGRSAR